MVEGSSCGPRLLVSARASDHYNFTAFFRRGKHRRGTNYLAVGDQVASFSEPLTWVQFSRSRPSPSDARLTRTRFSLRGSKKGVVAFSIC